MEAKGKVVLPSGASGSTVNLRASTEMKNGKPTGVVLTKVPVGSEVTILADEGQWCYLEYNGKTGWMMSNYIEYHGQGDESSAGGMTEEERAKIDAALRSINDAVEVIGSIVGRG